MWVPEAGTGRDGNGRVLGLGKGRRGTGRGAGETGEEEGWAMTGSRRESAGGSCDGRQRGATDGRAQTAPTGLRGVGEGETRPHRAEVGRANRVVGDMGAAWAGVTGPGGGEWGEGENAQGRKWSKERSHGEGQEAGCRGKEAGMPGGPHNERPEKECGTWVGCTCQKGGGNATVTGGCQGWEPGQEAGRG